MKEKEKERQGERRKGEKLTVTWVSEGRRLVVPDRSTQPPPGSRESESRSVSGRLPSAEVVRVVVPSAPYTSVERGFPVSKPWSRPIFNGNDGHQEHVVSGILYLFSSYFFFRRKRIIYVHIIYIYIYMGGLYMLRVYTVFN